MDNIKVLLVADETDYLEMLKARMEAHNYKIVTAANGKECIEAAKRSSPDIIVIDIMMPELDGIATILKLKAIKELKAIPVIVCTAVRENEDEIVAKNLGVAGYFRKTSPAKELAAKIEEVLKR